ncbi:hypothetical protein JZ751_011049 [Albula glossodonta]|uniref:Uncharacterized protein n=1 Tax=Albula glossodonta TaxID=121402 RepID=A0A8T2NYC3_9TELE|nr:hypothetical protein JZ751_011049 [Albula glossodonta]
MQRRQSMGRKNQDRRDDALFLSPVYSQHNSSTTISNSSCSMEPTLFERLSMQLKDAVDCIETQASEWGDNETASLLLSLDRATKTAPKQCPAPQVPSKGGLVCVTIGQGRYCKPMCNEGFDFDFLRKSRLYEACTAESSYSWTTQYIAGADTAYFPKDQDCFQTKSQSELERKVIQDFVSELQNKGITGKPEYQCLICG